jgi:hypothetical protein
MIYFCHIPKTSGTSVSKTLILNKDKIKFILGSDSNELKNKNLFIEHLLNCKNNDIIKGHYAATPFEIFPGIKGYSILRHPMDRLLSAFRFSQQPNPLEKPFKSVLYSFLTNQNPIESIGFDGKPNIQSLFLTQPLEWTHGVSNSVSVAHPTMSLLDVLSIIKKNNTTLSTMENRDYVIYEISNELKKITGNNIVLDPFIKSNENTFKINFIDIMSDFYDEIYDLNKLDFDLYNYVKKHESLTGRALRPSDINI